MDNENRLEKDIQKIIFGGNFARIQDGLERSRLFIIKSPSLKDKVFIDFIYQESIKEAKSKGLFSRLELRHIYKKKNIWTDEHDNLLDKLADGVRETKREIIDAQRKREKRVLSARLAVLQEKLEDLLRLKHELFGQSAEQYADEIKQMAIVFSSTYDECEKRLWNSWDEFQNDSDCRLIRNISLFIINSEGISGKRIRRLARSGTWRFQWQAGKGVGNLFDKPIVELDPSQQALVYWSQVYDSVYDSMDKPDDCIIENDDKLDKWFENQNRKRKVENIESGKETGRVKLSQRVSRHGEIFVVANPAINPHAPTTQEIENLNDSLARKFKAEEVKRIKEKKLINEKDLRSRHNRISRKLIGSKDAILSKGNLGGKRHGGKGASEILPGGTV